MSKMEITSKLSVELTTRINLGRQGAHAQLSILDIAHKPLDNLKRVKERFREIKELTNEINHNDLTYYFKANIARKRFNDLNNDIELFRNL